VDFRIPSMTWRVMRTLVAQDSHLGRFRNSLPLITGLVARGETGEIPGKVLAVH
jgi:hypothetical protein